MKSPTHSAENEKHLWVGNDRILVMTTATLLCDGLQDLEIVRVVALLVSDLLLLPVACLWAQPYTGLSMILIVGFLHRIEKHIVIWGLELYGMASDPSVKT